MCRYTRLWPQKIDFSTKIEVITKAISSSGFDGQEPIASSTQIENNQKIFNELNYIASALIVIAGVIFLYIAIYDKNLDTEIAFN